MKIKFYNHSCFSIETRETILLSDPYLSGTAFNDGWDLIVDNIVFDHNIDKRLFIYYSHEHPDHFSIPFLKSIDIEKRNKITVLYQKTQDARVKSYLEKEGFNVKELENKKKYEFSENFFITMGQVPFYDSWALVEVDGKKILNANDCILESPDRVADIKEVTESVDILFTQFSYANWVEGGIDNKSHREILAAEKLRRIKVQSDVINPEFIVPFASMVRFCHIDNSYMNDAINTPRRTVDFISNNTNSKPFLMIPYEIWDGHSDKINDDAIKFWDQAYAEGLRRQLITQKQSYSLKEIEQVSNERIAHVKKVNNAFLIALLTRFGMLPTQKIKISDLGLTVEFNWNKGLSLVDASNLKDYVEMSSESLHFLLKFDFGIDTLNVNARFQGTLTRKKSLIRTFSPVALNNTGRYISLLGLVSTFSEPAFIKQGLRTVGLAR